jgi:glycosyltransferase involved in cell wall biosynthesis
LRVLVVLAHPPVAEGSAAGRCAVGLLLGLAEHGLDVRAVAAELDGRAVDTGALPVEVVHAPVAGGWRTRLRRVTHPRGHLAFGAFGARVRELAREADVVHLDELESAPLGKGLAAPAALHLHWDLRRDRSAEPPWTAAGRLWAEMAAAERRARRGARWLVANSEPVAAALRRADPEADVTVMPLSLDPAHYAVRPAPAGPVAGLIGTASWAPTANATRRALERVWPAVRAAVPDAELQLAGHGITAAKLGVADSPAGVRWVGEVPSAPAFLGGLACLLYPLASGSGTKVKVLEAIALGVPVVTTPDGAEGIAPNDGVLVETDDARLADAAAELLRDPAARRERGAAARAAFLAHHAPAVAAAPLVALYRRMLA